MSREKTLHQIKVEQFLRGIGRPVPDLPQVPDDSELLTVWGRLMLEELFEYFDSVGVDVLLDGTAGHYRPLCFQDLSLRKNDRKPDLVGIADDVADMQVISTGMFSLCGIADVGMLEEVDDNNLLKVDPARGGRIDPVSGKFIKPPSHPKPDFGRRLKEQGWRGGDG